MSVSIHDVLEGLRGTALDERDKGDKFERLVLNLLRTEPEWVNRFSDVWLGSERRAGGGAGTPESTWSPS
ncbi:MAG: putative Helicase [Nocardioides sp.]|nr:putative Helicase [Nocardioides sp.]